jgi:enoyl-CoA hydratase
MAMKLEKERTTWVLSLDNPPVNAFSLAQFEEIFAMLARAESDDACRALVVTGSNGVFSAGIDIRALPRLEGEERKQLVRNVNRITCEAYRFPKPLVAAVCGHAVGLGAVLLACSDFRIAAEGNYRVGLNELDAGLPFPACPAAVVQATLSPTAARRLCLGSALYPPESPLLDELIDERVPAESLMRRALELAADRGRQAIYTEVKLQQRQGTITVLRTIIERDDDPLLALVWRIAPAGAARG